MGFLVCRFFVAVFLHPLRGTLIQLTTWARIVDDYLRALNFFIISNDKLKDGFYVLGSSWDPCVLEMCKKMTLQVVALHPEAMTSFLSLLVCHILLSRKDAGPFTRAEHPWWKSWTQSSENRMLKTITVRLKEFSFPNIT